MALWSLFVGAETNRFSTQVRAASPKAAVAQFLKKDTLANSIKAAHLKGWPTSFSVKDVVLFIAMDGLVNMYLCQLGREGKYASIVLVRTVSRQQT